MEHNSLLFQNQELSLEERLATLINELTLDEKISLLSTSQSAIPRLGIEEYHVGGEAAHGVVDRAGGRTTVFPQPLGLSSTWNPKLLKRIGDVIGDEARIFYEKSDKKTGLTLWAPTIDMERDPRWGRTEEAYGEDPYLTGKLSTELIKGMQGDDPFYVKMVAAPKHFYGNNNEFGREFMSNSIDPRNKFEYYLKAFEPAFREGKALSMMTAYNGINGVPCMQINELKDIVRDEWGMDGFIVSDGGALTLNVENYHYYDTYAEALADSLKKGIDCFVDKKELVEKSAYEALETGLITEKDLTIAIHNMLKVRFRLGHFDQSPERNPYFYQEESKMCSEEHAEVALQATKESIVLLKNKNQTLPLKKEQLKKVAVIGPTADVVFKDWYTGYAPYLITPLQGIRKALKNAEVSYVNGNDKIAIKSVNNQSFVRINDENKVVVKGVVVGEHETFELEEWGWNANLLKSLSNGKYVCQNEKNYAATSEEIYSWFVTEKIGFDTVNDNEDKFYLKNWQGKPLAVSNEGNLHVTDTPEMFEKYVLSSGIEEAVRAAKSSDTAIVFVGNQPMINGRETEDRSDIVLPKHQEELIEAVYEANPNTVVVVVGSYPFAINWVQKHIPAVLYTAHGSQMLGDGLASILFGDESPSGRLSMTWYKGIEQLPSIYDYDIIKGNRTYMYFEDEVLYPFGHGLSYGAFNYSSLRLSKEAIGTETELHVTVDIENTSDVEASEVVQLYASVLESDLKRPKRQLVAFEKVHLMPGEKRTVQLVVHSNQLTVWDVNKEAFILEQGKCILSVGASSEDIRLSAEVQIEGERRTTRTLQALTKAENYDDYENIYLSKGEHGLNSVTSRSKGWIYFKNTELKRNNELVIRINSLGIPGKISVGLNSQEVVASVETSSEWVGQWKDYNIEFQSEEEVQDLYIIFDGAVTVSTIQLL